MNHILRSVIRKFALVYLGDVIIYSTSIEQHIKHIDIVLGLLQKAGLKIKLLQLITWDMGFLTKESHLILKRQTQ